MTTIPQKIPHLYWFHCLSSFFSSFFIFVVFSRTLLEHFTRFLLLPFLPDTLHFRARRRAEGNYQTFWKKLSFASGIDTPIGACPNGHPTEYEPRARPLETVMTPLKPFTERMAIAVGFFQIPNLSLGLEISTDRSATKDPSTVEAFSIYSHSRCISLGYKHTNSIYVIRNGYRTGGNFS